MGLFSKDKTEEPTIAEMNGNMYLTKDEIRDLELHEARVQMQAALLEKFQLREQLLLIQQREQLAQIRGKQKDCVSSMERARSDYNQALAAIEERLDIKMSEYAVQEDGSLRHIPADDDTNE